MKKEINKHLFIWVGNFLFGSFGIDRFMRGQIFIGIIKLLFNWLTLGLWGTIDWIISVYKGYYVFNKDQNITFINGLYMK